MFASAAAADARFETGRGVVRVTGVTAGELLVEIPRDALTTTVLVNGRTYLVRENGAIRVDSAIHEDPDSEIVFQVRP